ncbi:hypothetical protein B0O80DRAFT_438629 [Mortierella sp. GBAus27b]|nr:hypothetical protein BGX31_008158 [Mortierella sp. GBA43]KAI8360182.1 hypothetical protein B0O80DRAFT_438629 [Mortierella sp. GBAus27b]
MEMITYPSKKPTIAVMFIGNTGVGKSTLLSQLGGNFKSGVAMMEGLTKDVSEQIITMDGQQVVLMDVPGLYEIDDEATKANGKKLTEALKRGYHYILFLVLKASNRFIEKPDLALMSIVNKCVRQADGAKVDFQVIINQVQGKEVFGLYKGLAEDNFQTFFASPVARRYNLDLQVNEVVMLEFIDDAAKRKRFRGVLIKAIKNRSGVSVRLEDDIKAESEDPEKFANIALGFAAGMGVMVVGVGAAAAAAAGTATAGTGILVSNAGVIQAAAAGTVTAGTGFLVERFLGRIPYLFSRR